MLSRKFHQVGLGSIPDLSLSIISSPTSIPVQDLLVQQLRNIAQGQPLNDAANISGHTEQVAHPPHYREDSGFEAIDVIEAWELNFNLGNVVKYVCRAGLKGKQSSTEDLEKALWYIQRELETRTKQTT